MEITKNIIGTVNEIEEVFKNSNKLSIRHYKALIKEEIRDEDLNKNFKFEVNIRFSDDLEKGVLSAKKVSDLLLLNAGAITKDNIHLYYEFMSDEDLSLLDNNVFIDDRVKKEFCGTLLPHYNYSLFSIRLDKINKLLKVPSHHLDFKVFRLLKSKVYSDDLIQVGLIVFVVKDTLKPIDEYIEDIKASSEYKVYKNSLLTNEEKRAYNTGEMPNSPNYKKRCAVNRLRG